MDGDMSFSNVSKITFSKRPIPLTANYRPIYKIAELVLVLQMCCYRKSASLIKLHFFSWILKSGKLMDQLIYSLDNKLTFSESVWRLEPSVNRALSFAVAEELIVQKGATYKLSTKGEAFVKLLLQNKHIMMEEKQFLSNVGKRVTEEFIKSLVRG